METIRIDGVALEFQRLTPAGGLPGAGPLVFLHEGLGSVSMWRDWPQQLCDATGRTAVVYSRQGYGGSDPRPDVRGPTREEAGRRMGRLPPDYMHHEAWTVLPRLLDALDVHDPVLIGHSDGGTIALLHAARHPVQACVVMAPHVIVEPVSIESITAARDAYGTGLRDRLARYHADVDSAFWQWNDVWLSPAFRDFDIRPQCRHITPPVLALQGREDPYGTLAQIEDIHPAGAIERQVLEQCGHSPHREQPDATTAVIRDFLSRHAATPATA